MIAGLRDIHLPAAASFWPLASGVKLIIAIIFILSCISFYFYLKRWLFFRAKRIALKQLDALEKQGLTKDLLPQISILLRRTVLAYYPRLQVASLTDINWLNFLNQHAQVKMDEKIISAPYQKPNKKNVMKKKIIQQVRAWINDLRYQ